MKKIGMVGLILVSLFFCTSTTANAVAYKTFGKSRLSSGIGNYGRNTRQYWFSGGFATAADQNIVIRAMNKWVHSNGTGAYTPISFTRTTSQANATIDIHRGGPIAGVLGQTRGYNGNSVVAPFGRTNWYWAQITVTTEYARSSSIIKDRTMAHEIGHAFGLDHNNTISNTVMRRSNAADVPPGPTINDFAGINYLY